MVVKTSIFFSLVNYPCKNGVSISCLCTGVEIKWNNPWRYCKIIWSGHIPGNMGYGAPILLRNRPLVWDGLSLKVMFKYFERTLIFKNEALGANRTEDTKIKDIPCCPTMLRTPSCG
jgi:hypothetical protein